MAIQPGRAAAAASRWSRACCTAAGSGTRRMSRNASPSRPSVPLARFDTLHFVESTARQFVVADLHGEFGQSKLHAQIVAA